MRTTFLMWSPSVGLFLTTLYSLYQGAASLTTSIKRFNFTIFDHNSWLKARERKHNKFLSKTDKTHEKCTPEHIMYYQMALKLHKLLNEHDHQLSFEHVTMMDQIVCTSRQINFQILRKFNTKIALNTTANKFYPLNNLINLDRLNMSYVHFKKLAKIQFLVNGKTWKLIVFLTGEFH